MKKLLILSLIIMMFILSGCFSSSSDDETEILHPVNLPEKIHTFAYTESLNNNEVEVKYDYKSTIDVSGKEIERYDYTYDEDGMLTELLITSNYDEIQKIKQINTYLDGKISKTEMLVLNNDTNEYELQSYHTNAYNLQGNIIENIVYDQNDNPIEKEEYQYDDLGTNYISYTLSEFDNEKSSYEIQEEHTVKYLKDDEGNFIFSEKDSTKKLEYKILNKTYKDDDIEEDFIEYSYNNNNMLSIVNTFDSMGNVVEIQIFEYDSLKRIIKSSTLIGNDMQSYYQYFYRNDIDEKYSEVQYHNDNFESKLQKKYIFDFEEGDNGEIIETVEEYTYENSLNEEAALQFKNLFNK